MHQSYLFQTWIEFYKNSYLQNKRRNNQFGRSIVAGVKTSIIPIEDKKKIREPERKEINDVPIKIISPSQALVEQAETKIERYVLKRKTEPCKAPNNAKRAKGKTNQKITLRGAKIFPIDKMAMISK